VLGDLGLGPRQRRNWTLLNPFCVIFATLRDSFEAATVVRKFFVPLSPIYYSQGGYLCIQLR
jgi:hypothetical protein